MVRGRDGGDGEEREFDGGSSWGKAFIARISAGRTGYRPANRLCFALFSQVQSLRPRRPNKGLCPVIVLPLSFDGAKDARGGYCYIRTGTGRVPVIRVPGFRLRPETPGMLGNAMKVSERSREEPRVLVLLNFSSQPLDDLLYSLIVLLLSFTMIPPCAQDNKSI